MANKVKACNIHETKKSFSFRGRKECIRGYKLVDLTDGAEVLDIRLYKGRSSSASVVYCACWISWKNTYGTGSGQAGGGGYDKESAAISDALEDAGVIFEKNFAGVGLNAAEDAMKALAEHLGVVAPFVVSFHP